MKKNQYLIITVDFTELKLLNLRWLIFILMCIIFTMLASFKIEPTIKTVEVKTASQPEPKTVIFSKDEFIVKRQQLVFKYLIAHKVNRVDQLDTEKIKEMNTQIAIMFKKLLLNDNTIRQHVYDFFTDNKEVNKIETSLMEQTKFHIPASIILAQSALETGWGSKVVNNNYFGIKDKSQFSTPIITTEYFNAKEIKRNKRKIISKQIVIKKGKKLYKCKVKDRFKNYGSAWESFREHSLFLSTNIRYAPLFTKGKNYKEWANMIGSTKYGGVGYATSPVYGEQLKSIIEKYNLHLLDY